jgi:hypothetical protein
MTYEMAAHEFRLTVERSTFANKPQRAAAMKALRETAEGLATQFAYDNPRFDRDKFLTACGLA